LLFRLTGWEAPLNVPGGQPIGALEWFFAAIAKRIRGMIPKRRETPEEATA